MERKELTDIEFQEIIEEASRLVGVDSTAFRGGRTSNIVRPYRDALFYILASEFDLSQREIVKRMGCNRNTVVDGLKRAKTDQDVKTAAILIRARMRRLEIGL